MKVKVLTTAQAKALHKRFDKWFEIQPIPVNPDKWIVAIDTLAALKEFMIDKVGVNPSLKDKALTIWNAIKDLPTYELDDYPQFQYNLDLDKNNSDNTAYRARFAELDAREDVT